MVTLAFNRLSFSIRRLFKFLNGAQDHKSCVGSNFHVGFECVGEADALRAAHESPLFPVFPLGTIDGHFIFLM